MEQMTKGKTEVWGGGHHDHLPVFSKKAVNWYKRWHNLRHVDVQIMIYEEGSESDGQWGSCNEIEGRYEIEVYGSQPLRDFIATIMHEMIHVKQWETGTWDNDGEEEAEFYQYILADKFWKSGGMIHDE